MNHTDLVLTERRGRAGVITLNRPRAINALTYEMILAIAEALEQWRDDPEIALVIVRGVGERGLCSGGDVAQARAAIIGGEPEKAARFFIDEYAMNLTIAEYPKPYVSFMEGVVLGGGVGVSAHGSHRIVTETSRVGMPEVGIGLMPDVGATWLLAHAPDELGTYMAMTGAHINASQAIEAGLADYFVHGDRLGALFEALCATGDASEVAKAAAAATAATGGQVPPGFEDREAIARAFRGDDPEAIVARVQEEAAAGTAWAVAAMKAFDHACPTSVAVSLAAQRKAAAMTLAEVLAMEGRMAVAMGNRPDFAEGVRAQLVDKDRDPKWTPAKLSDVDKDEVERIVR